MTISSRIHNNDIHEMNISVRTNLLNIGKPCYLRELFIEDPKFRETCSQEKLCFFQITEFLFYAL
ncbi:Protein of unknown function [Cotesia congregata]|uniref:Uncharacterized protein n=1 Tax=Cotesia congregata TaxID=51543 RepID=A0A8J2HP42_COTCN|nr:Protein of unknown function [Cotesia congregata]